MQQPNLLAASMLVALLLLAVLRWRIAMPIAEGGTPLPWPAPSGDEDQQPETDRSPPRQWPRGLSAAVALAAAVRVALLVTLHA